MLNSKNLDAVCLNIISKENSFGSDSNKIDIILTNRVVELKKESKLKLSFKILDTIKELDCE